MQSIVLLDRRSIVHQVERGLIDFVANLFGNFEERYVVCCGFRLNACVHRDLLLRAGAIHEVLVSLLHLCASTRNLVVDPYDQL